MEIIDGGVTSAKGFKAAGIHAGLKKAKKDMAMVVSECTAETAAVFTTNKVKAAPVIWDQGVKESGKAMAVVINSGNANACTGAQGLKDAEDTAAAAADRHIYDNNRCEKRHFRSWQGRKAFLPFL